MRGRSPLFGTAESDLCAHRNQRGALLVFPGQPDRFFHQVQVIAVRNGQHLPAIGLEPQTDIFGERNLRISFDGDMVVVIQINQFSEAERRRQRRCFGADTFHQVPVGYQSVRIVIDNRQSRFVIYGCQMFFRQGHPDSHGKALSQWSRSGFHTRCHAIFRMTRSHGFPLAKFFDFTDRQIITECMQQGI